MLSSHVLAQCYRTVEAMGPVCSMLGALLDVSSGIGGQADGYC